MAVMDDPLEPQRITRLAPFADVLARIEAIARPVAPRMAAPAPGQVLAADVSVAAPLPPRAVALRDGWAVSSEAVGDAGPFVPALLTPPPPFVACGDPLPDGADAVLPPDAVTLGIGFAAATVCTAPGMDVLAAGADAHPRQRLRRAGETLRAIDVAVLGAARIAEISIRAPRVRVVAAAALDPEQDFVAPLIARAIESSGGRAERVAACGADALDHVLAEEGGDAVIAIGGTGQGPTDGSVRTLARIGRVEMHGLGVWPGDTAALGVAGARPVLILPGRLDGALAVWLTVGVHLVRCLAGSTEAPPRRTATLKRKVTSIIGLAEVVPVTACAGGVEPLAFGYFPLQALARAEGWILVPPGSEGYAAGATVEVMRFP
jgi:molybdopterin biosynthesis enzyme